MHFYAQFTVRNVFKPEKVQAVTTGAETLHVLKKKKSRSGFLQGWEDESVLSTFILAVY